MSGDGANIHRVGEIMQEGAEFMKKPPGFISKTPLIIPDGPFAGVAVPAKRFVKIYADPPWGWRTWGAVDKIPHRSEAAPYLPMGKAALEALPVASLGATHCALFMWTVSSHLDQAIDLMRSWHFQFRSVAFIWVKTDAAGKPRMSLGRWTRQEAEICIMGARGRPPRRPKPIGTRVRQVIMAPRREHSRKPDEIRDRIDQLIDGPAIELFARSSAPGWTSWGNEAGKFDAEPSTPASPARTETLPAGCVAGRPGALCRCDGCAHRLERIRALIAER